MSADWHDSSVQGVITSCDYGLSCGLSSDPTGVPILRMGNLQGGRVLFDDLKFAPPEKVQEQHLLRRGDLLLNRTNSIDLVGKVGLFRGETRATFASYLFRIRADPARAVPEWLAQVLHSPTYQAMLRDIATPGVSQANINRERLRALPLLVPPIGEQKKIAAILSSADEAIEATQAVIDQLQVVKKAMMAELLTRGLPGRHTRFKQTELGEVPEEWEVVRMDSLAIPRGMVGGPFGSDLTAADYVAEPGIPVIRGGNVSMGRFHAQDFVFVSREKANELAKNTARTGDLVMTQRGASLGEVTLLPHGAASGFFIISQTMMRLTPDASKISPRFLLHYTCSPPAQSWLKDHAIATGQPHLNLGIYREMPAVVPAVAEQDAIAAAMDRIDAVHDATEAHLAQLRAAKAGLMSVLLTGEVRVKPDEGAG